MTDHPAAPNPIAGERPCLVAGFDGGPAAATVLAAAADLARRLGAHLRVVHSVGLADFPVDPDDPAWEADASRTLTDERDEVTRVLAGLGIDWSYAVHRDDPCDALMAEAKSVDATMIVVGSRGEGWQAVLDHLARPSVTHRLIRRSPRPVVVVGPGVQAHRVPPHR